jgi:hypothetical protein
MKLGDVVTITRVYRRREHSRWNEKARCHETVKAWEPWQVKERRAIFLGWRTLSNGIREWEPEAGAIFTPESYIKAALVCFSTKENPVYVPVDGCRE